MKGLIKIAHLKLPFSLVIVAGMGLVLHLNGTSAVAQTQPDSAVPKEEPPKTSIQIINATSVPEVELSVNGTPVYRSFPQGIFSNDGTTTVLKPVYSVKDKASSVAVEHKSEFPANSNQCVVMIGDFSIPENPDSYLVGVLNAKEPSGAGAKKPNVLFIELDNRLPKEMAPLRFRVINGMPEVPLTVDDKGAKILLKPGEMHELAGRTAMDNILVTIKDKAYPVFMNQVGELHNCIIVFYLTKEGPAFMRTFESTRMISKNVAPKPAEEGQ